MLAEDAPQQHGIPGLDQHPGLDRLRGVGNAVGILAAHHAHDLAWQVHNMLLDHQVVADDVDGGRRGDQSDLVYLIFEQLAVLHLDDILLAELAALHIHDHRNGGVRCARYAQDLQDIERLAPCDVIDHRSVLDGLDAKLARLIFGIAQGFFGLHYLGLHCSCTSPDQHLEQRHAHGNAVEGLLEVARMGRAVHIGRDLVHAGQRMHDYQVLSSTCQELGSEPVGSGDLIVLLGVREALSLNARHVKHVHVVHNLGEVAHLANFGALAEEIGADGFGHAQSGRRDQRDVGSVEREGVSKRVNSASVLEVANQGDLEVVDAALLFFYGVEIEKSLRGMMARAVSRVEHGHGRELRGKPRRAFFGMADHQSIGIAADDAHRIGQRLPLGDGAALRGPQVYDAAAQALHGGLKGHSRSSGWFKEKKSENFAREHIAFFAPGVGFQG